MTNSSSPQARSQLLLEETVADYVRGRLNALQCAAIEQRQASDADFAALIQLERVLQAGFDEMRATAAVPTPSFAALRERLQRPTLMERLKGWLVAPAQGPSWATAAALLVLIAAAGFWRNEPPVADSQTLAARDIPEYQTLTATAVTPQGAEWRLVFAPSATDEARTALLREFNLEALSAPDALGSLWVRSSATDGALADRLRGDRRLIVVQSVPLQPTP